MVNRWVAWAIVSLMWVVQGCAGKEATKEDVAEYCASFDDAGARPVVCEMAKDAP